MVRSEIFVITLSAMIYLFSHSLIKECEFYHYAFNHEHFLSFAELPVPHVHTLYIYILHKILTDKFYWPYFVLGEMVYWLGCLAETTNIAWI